MNFVEILNRVLKEKYSAFFFTPIIQNESFCFLFENPVKVLTINNLKEKDKILNEAENLLNEGLTAYSLIKYEAGFLFEKRLNEFLNKNDKDLLQFFFFNQSDVLKIDTKSIDFPDQIKQEFSIENFIINIDKKDYISSINRIKKYIEEGDTYQVNYTLKGKFDFKCDIANLFLNLIFNQSANYSALINTGDEIILSISPELFFKTEDDKIIAQPMKGTISRGKDIDEDSAKKTLLQNSEKNRAENLMIVDLLRNDLGRIAEFNSVKAEKLYEVEKYESLFQMTSTIEAKLKKDIKIGEIISNIFPCGSVTGAPKIRTMQIINELEKERRGLYTGAIGISGLGKFPNANVFNVAIRTVIINTKTEKGEIGLGSGVVYDSDPEKEYEEVLLKSDFLKKPLPYFELIETMRVEKNKIQLFHSHLDRLRKSADYFLFFYDEEIIKNYIENLLKNIDEDKSYRLRVMLNKWGRLKHEMKELSEIKTPVKIILSDERVSSENKFQYFKTTNRKFYEEKHAEYSSKGFFDVIFLNERDEVAEGAISNIFIRKGDKIFTPPLSSGILDGIYRKEMLKRKNVEEKILYKNDLFSADKIILTNAVRGEIKVDEFC